MPPTTIYSRRWVLSLVLIFAFTFVNAQKNYSVKGSLVDTAGSPLIQSTIMLLDMDSTFLDFTQSDLDGNFEFKKIKRGNHLLKVTFIGHIPVTKNVSYVEGDIDLGSIVMKEISTELMEVVVKAARAPIKLRGDTIEYDATTFRVPEGSSVEDLLKRLPGIQVDQDGSITSDGHSVNKVTVDGKKFFGDDPKAATKNLPAEGIAKVQVFDETTEEEEITGTQDKSNQNKTMNLELKEGYKSGAFGKVAAGGGSDDRYEIKGNYNRFDDKIQFSLIGVANNTGRNGLSWDDYQGFLGSESWSFNDDGIYGFGGGFSFSFGGGGDDGLESSLQSIFFSGQQNGLPENTNGGINFNFDHKKTKLSSYYFINRKALIATTTSEKETFLDPINALESSQNENDTNAIGHRAEVELKQEIDSFHTFTLKTQFAALDNTGIFTRESSARFANESNNTNAVSFRNSNDSNGHLVNVRGVFSKKFRSNKRRRFGVNSSYQTSNLDRIQQQFSTNEIFDSFGTSARQVIDQNFDNITSKDVFRVNALYVEPLGEKFTLQNFYNLSSRQETGDREVLDILNNESSVNTFLTRNYDNEINMNRFGSSLKYGHGGFNLSLGAAFQRFSLNGSFEGASADFRGEVDQTFDLWIPNVTVFFQPFRNSYLNLAYTVGAREPQINNLQPVIDNSNPFYLREGNPDLLPEVSKAFSMYFSINKPLTGFRVWVNASHNFFTNQIVTEEFIDEGLVTRIRPINFDGGGQSNFGLGVNVPIKPNKIQFRINLWSNIRDSNAFVNGELNNTNTLSLNPSFRLSLTPNQKFSLYLNSSFGTERTEYNINTQLNQTSRNFTYGLEVNTDLVLGLKLESDFNLRQFNNDRLDLNEDIPIWNISISRQFLKDKKGELRLSLYDAFNENTSISQFASNYSIIKSDTRTLARYYLLTFTYNLKGGGSDKGNSMIIVH